MPASISTMLASIRNAVFTASEYTKRYSINGESLTTNPYRCCAAKSAPRLRASSVSVSRRSARLRLTPTATHFGSGLATLLGFDLYTRWHDMRGRWLHVPRDWPPVPGLEPVLMRDLDPEFIQDR